MLTEKNIQRMYLNDIIEYFISEYFLEILLVILVILLIKLVIREMRCWYWKINERISLMNEQINALLRIVDRQDEEISILREINNKLSNENNVNIEVTNEAAATEKDSE